MNEQVSLSYMLAHPEVVSLSLARPLLLGLLLLIPLLHYFGRSERRGRVPFWLRTAAVTALILAMAGLQLRARLPETRLTLIAAVDVSDSIDRHGREWEERYVASLSAALPPGDELGVVQFAADAAVMQAPAPATRYQWNPLSLSTTSTNLAAGLDSALSLFPADRERRIVLVSDGNETRGNSLSRITSARLSKVAIFAAVPPREGGTDVAIDKIAVPSVVTEGTVFPVRIVVRNDAAARQATLELSADGETLGVETVTLQSGLTAVEIPYELHAQGSRRLEAKVRADGDSIAGNNQRSTTVTVSGKPHVLVVTPKRTSALATALRRKDFEVAVIAPNDLAISADELVGYHAIVFDGVTAKSFGGRSFDALESYVRDGGGFVMAGGSASFGDADLKKTPLEKLLPVTLEPRKPPKREREPLALFLLLDRSKSMGYHFRNRFEFSEDQSKLVYAKRAALSVVRQLKDTDQLGVIAFDSLAFELASLQRVRDNRIILERDIPRIQVGGGTDFYDALQSALREITAARATNGHVILMTDGNTNRPPGEHDALIEALARAHISVTTIRIGEDDEDLSLLKKLSKRTGGAFYEVANAQTLPEVLLKDTAQQSVQTPQGEPTFVPRLEGVSQILQGIDAQDIPELSGYAMAHARPGAEVLVHVASGEKKEPVLATWQYGLGHVAAFTADIEDDAAAWLGWDGFGKLWSQILHWSAPEHTPLDFSIHSHRRSDGITLDVETFADIGSGLLSARLIDKSQNLEVPLVADGPRKFTANLANIPGGYYSLSLSTRLPNGGVRQRNHPLRIAAEPDPSQEEYEHLQPNLPLLQRLTGETGGRVDAPVRDVVGRKAGTRRVDHPLDWWLVPLAMILFLGEIAYRRFVVGSFSAQSGSPSFGG